MSKVLLLNGPCFNFQGIIEPGIYGSTTVKQIEDRVSSSLAKRNIIYESFQSNSENEIIFWLNKQSGADFLLLNPGTLAHRSLRLRDVVLKMKVPFVEVHLTNFYNFQESSYCSIFSDISIGSLLGLGLKGFSLASNLAADFLEQKNEEKTKLIKSIS